MPKFGNCKLTGASGAYVKSHIYPQAFTRPTVAGSHLIEAGPHQRPIKRFTSWYDDQIVTREGEDILSRYDNDAFDELTRLKLVWRSWGPMQTLATPDHKPLNGIYGLRIIENCRANDLRLFFLSIFWRAAISNRPECNQIKLHPKELDELTRMVVEGDAGDPTRYAISLIQLSTRHIVHSVAPAYFEKRVPSLESTEPNFRNVQKIIPGYRFYIDGLVVHIHRNSEPDNRASSENQIYKTILANCRSLGIITMPFERSFQSDLIRTSIEEDYRKWPQTMASLMGPQD